MGSRQRPHTPAALSGSRLLGPRRRPQIAASSGSSNKAPGFAGGYLLLETTFETDEGAVTVTDFMSRRDGVSDVMRLVRGLRGVLRMRTELTVRFDYGSVVPWVSRQEDGRLQLVAGPDRLLLSEEVGACGEGLSTVAEFEVASSQELAFALSWSQSYRAAPEKLDVTSSLAGIEAFWSDWVAPFKPAGEWSGVVLRSLLTLKGLAHWETGGIVAAATTSLPEQLKGSRNWDYRFCWLRDATFTLFALVESGFLKEAKAWTSWLLRAVAGAPDMIQIMYGVAGERHLNEYEVPWLPGYEGASPVRIGNAAAAQMQLDVYGEVIDAAYRARKYGLTNNAAWALHSALLAHLETVWDQPDEGIWEVRGGPKHFTHSKVMAWVAFDRGVRAAEEFGLAAPLDRWRALRQRIHDDVCRRGFDVARNTFVQFYGSNTLDASLLLIALVGFLPASDPRIKGTVAAIERSLMHEGFVMRYDTGCGTDGLPPGEGAFLACSFWLVDNYVLQGRTEDARALFARLISLCNDVGLLAEEYDATAKRQLGNFPQAFSHLALINSARNLTAALGPAHKRSTHNHS